MPGEQVGDLVMVVEDDADILWIWGEVLTESGYRVIQANNGFEAWGRATSTTEERVSVIVTDVRMPEMDGIELIHHLREDVGARDIPIVIVTAEPQSAIDRAQEVGDWTYIGEPIRIVMKPVDLNVLGQIVAMALLHVAPPAGAQIWPSGSHAQTIM